MTTPGYRAIRRSLARSYDPGEGDADVQVVDVDLAGDRRLMLQHRTRPGQLLSKKDAETHPAPHLGPYGATKSGCRKSTTTPTTYSPRTRQIHRRRNGSWPLLSPAPSPRYWERAGAKGRTLREHILPAGSLSQPSPSGRGL